MTSLHIDFETRSAIDLKKSGVYPYSTDPTTDVWCAAYAVSDGEVKLWTPGQPVPSEIRIAVMLGTPIVAHNANFERAIFAGIMGPRHGWPIPKLEQWRCTMVMALAMSLPPGLGECAKALHLNVHKDDDGKSLMLRMAKPRKIEDVPEELVELQIREWCAAYARGRGDTALADEHATGVAEMRKRFSRKLTWWDVPEKLEKLYAYCRQDVEVEREIERHLLPLRAQELNLWHLDQRINDRGIHVDTELCRQALQIVDTAAKWLNDEIREITDGAVKATTNVAQITAWLATQGVFTPSLDKTTLAELLTRSDLSDDVRRVLGIRAEGAKAAVKKIAALLAGTSADSRARGLLQFHAAGTGRWAGRRFQPQNIARPKSNNVDAAIEAVATGSAAFVSLVHGEPLAVVSDCLRGLVGAAAGNTLYAADFSNIEGRLIAWLAGEEWKLDAFRDFDRGIGADIYKLAYARSFGIDATAVDKDQRQIGKVMELALGYQGGVGAFQKMAVGYGVVVEDARADELKTMWRDAHPAVVQLWYDLERSATSAILWPGTTWHAGAKERIAFRVAGSFLYMRLPSGRAIVYPYPCIKRKLMPWTKDGAYIRTDVIEGVEIPIYEQLPVWKDSICYKGVDQYTRQWTDQFAHGGLLANNAVQGTARDIEAEAMVRVERAGYPIVLTVHDEIVSETPKTFGSVEEFEKLMVELPAWASGLPLAASAWSAERYRK